MSELTHIDAAGRGKMVDIGAKNDTRRAAVARGYVSMEQATLEKVKKGEMGKGDVLGVAQTAGIMAAKQTWQLIPMCHPLLLTSVDMDFKIREEEQKGIIEIEAKVTTTGKTGVEMEALTAVSVAALTLYDMCKAVDKDMVIHEIYLVEKTGGKSGQYRKKEK